MASDLDKKINTFAIRSFRNVADKDYIAARLAFRADLLPQFMWMAQQAIEKYAKGILCFYRVPAPKLGHDIDRAMKLLSKLPMKVAFTDGPRKMIEHIGTYGPYRYMEAPWDLHGHALPKFDVAIWQLRRYCQPIDHEKLNADGSDPRILKSLADSDTQPRHKFKIPGGYLEEVMSEKDHPSREPLLWQNICYSGRKRDTVKSSFKLSAENPPLMFHPEILPHLVPLVYIPESVKNAVRTVWAPAKDAREAERKKSPRAVSDPRG